MKKFLILTVVVAGLVAGCGDDDDSSDYYVRFQVVGGATFEYRAGFTNYGGNPGGNQAAVGYSCFYASQTARYGTDEYSGLFTGSSNYIDFSVTGTLVPGTFTINGLRWKDDAGVRYFIDGTIEHIVFTEVGPVGGVYSGTFNALLRNAGGALTNILTNGSFRLPRLPDEVFWDT